MSATVIAELIERVGLLEHADPAADARLMAALVAPEGAYAAISQFNGLWCVYSGDDRRGFPKPYEIPRGFRLEHERAFTASTDAALALVERVLPGAAYVINVFDVQRKPTVVRTARVHLSAYEGAGSGSLGAGPTPPLAILAALLTALQSQTPGPTGASNEGGGHVG